MKNEKRHGIRYLYLITLFTLLISMTSFADQTYYYAYTIMPEESPYRDLSNSRKSISVTENNDGSYTVDDGYSSVTLTKADDGSYYGMTQYISYSLNNDQLSLGYDDPSADIFLASPFTGGWVDFDNKWYYLGDDGKALTNTTTPDGYQVNAYGQWVVNGVVQTKGTEQNVSVGITPTICEKYKDIVMQEHSKSNGTGYKLFYLDDDNIPEMTVNYPGYGLKILSSDGVNVYFIAADSYGDYFLPYGTHGRDYICYERSGRIDTGANVDATTTFIPEYLFYDKVNKAFVYADTAPAISGNFTELCYDDLSAAEMLRDLDYLAQGKQPLGSGGDWAEG